ncbi:flagellar hook capping FlgD N-terminal domain-containing protein [Gorillibacterium timonense]|uniref:flagellar hook capping FlgD N-terminal domain-containing protein n=1 Tax=Gorillibacterium timonense TaxID=1689269 RepID=UPI00071D3516|nr:flagellar hook capping FlgD N-terminal domain-containing protein [Gorillibacterium timonense]
MADNAISTKNVWPYYSSGNTSTASKTDNSLGKDEFLKILIAQLKNQDPMNPMKDQEFIAQMAQFSSVEQLSNMANEMKLLRQSVGLSPELIDKKVTWEETDSTGAIVSKSGIVTSLSMKKGVQYVQVDGQDIKAELLTRVEKAEG